jgi:hypothetical protein
MAGSNVEICNRALDLLGAPTITALDENSVSARLCLRNYAPARDAVLRLYPWNEATARASLAADVTAPAWGFALAYTLPTDCLRLVTIEEELRSAGAWRVEGAKVLTDVSAPLRIRYIRRLTDPGLIGPLLADAIAARLAAAIAFGLTNNASQAESMRGLMEMAIREARRIDALEQSQDEALVADDWTNARFSSYGPVR